MSREPTYPKDAAVAPAGPGLPASETARPSDERPGKKLATGVAIGIGSAAIVAALLYANRSKRSGKDG